MYISNTEKIDIPDFLSDGYDIVVTTYEMCKAPALSRLWGRQQLNLCVLNEDHRIKPLQAQRSQAVRKIHCEACVILSGAPLANKLVELHALLNSSYLMSLQLWIPLRWLLT